MRILYLLAAAVVAVFGAMAATVFGQETPAPPQDGFTDAVSFLGSGPGVIALTMMIVQGIKNGFATTPGLQRVPIWVYTVAVALGLTVLGNKIFGTLEGNLGQLLYSAALNALSASGVYQIFHQPGASPATAGKNGPG